jgi:hypothetical protein
MIVSKRKIETGNERPNETSIHLRQKNNRVLTALGALSLAGVLAFGAFAQRLEQKVVFHIDGKIGSESVRKGTYLLVVPDVLEGSAELRIGKRTLSLPFRKQMIEQASGTDRVTYQMNEDGSRSVATITPKGQLFTLVLGS